MSSSAVLYLFIRDPVSRVLRGVCCCNARHIRWERCVYWVMFFCVGSNYCMLRETYLDVVSGVVVRICVDSGIVAEWKIADNSVPQL